jgi:hypothetical protein
MRLGKRCRKPERANPSVPVRPDVDATRLLLSGAHLPPAISWPSLDLKPTEVDANILLRSRGSTILPPATVGRLVHSMQAIVNTFVGLSSWLLPNEELEYSSRPDPHKMRPCRARDSLLKLPPWIRR